MHVVLITKATDISLVIRWMQKKLGWMTILSWSLVANTHITWITVADRSCVFSKISLKFVPQDTLLSIKDC